MKPDCRQCGLCCIATSDQEAFCDLTDEDLKKLQAALGDRWVGHNVFFASSFDRLVAVLDGGKHPDAALRTKLRVLKTGPLKGCEICACAMLKGTPMKSVSCSIYDNRPRTCRVSVKPGNRDCLKIRHHFVEALEDAHAASDRG